MEIRALKPGRIAELLAEAGKHFERALGFHKNGARDEELVCLKVALAHVSEALTPVDAIRKEVLDVLQRGMANYGVSGSHLYGASVEMGNDRLTTADDARKFGEGFFAGRKGDPIDRCDKAWLIGYRYGEAVRKDA